MNDCKSLADALVAAGAAASLGNELSMIKQRLSRNKTHFQRVEGTIAADVLTKGKERGHVELLRKQLNSARYQFRATSEMLEERRQVRERKLLRHRERR